MSKINTAYWGANTDPAVIGGYTYSYGVSTNNIRALIANGVYNPNTDSFDLSASPWGIGYSAAGNRGQIVILRNGSRDGSAPGNITKIMFDGHDKENSNRPFALIDKNHYFRDSFRWLQSRVGGDITVDSSNYMKNAAVAYESQYLSNNSTTNGCLSLAKVATYLDYQKYKLRVTGFIYINLDTGVMSGFNFLNASETPEQAKTRFENFSFPEHMAIVGIKVQMTGYAAASGSPTGWNTDTIVGDIGNAIQLRGHSIGTCINFNQITATADDDTKFKLCFTWSLGVYNNSYDEDSYGTSPYNYWSNPPYVQNIPVEGENYRTGVQPTYNRVQVNGLGFSFDDQYRNTNIAGNFCDKEQNFSDIKYKQRPLLYKIVNSAMSEVREGTALTQNTQQFRITSIYEIVDSDTFTKSQILALIKHEVAFYGFQFYISWGNSDGGTWSIGDSDLYLPKFDEHLITTGNYTSGTASLSEPNASWGNVFDDSMPEYDTEYNPNPHEKSKDENDSGDLYNFGSLNKFPSCLTAYAMSLEKFQSVLQSINSMYQTDPDGVKQWELDFKGSNPSDYIVGAYVSVCNFGLSESTYPITIGPVDLSVAVPSMVANKILFTDSGYFDCGSVDIDHFYNDFRDYAPYTQLELYLPLCGTVELDTAYFIGHSVSITYYYDYNTMSCSACIYRDGITLYKVVNGSIGAEIPLTSMRMGEYQNAIHALEQAQKQNEIRMASAMVSMGISAAGLLAAPATGGASLGLTALGLNGIKTGIETANAIEDINYSIEHKQPAPTQTGASEAQNAFCVGSMYPYLFIKRAKTLEDFDAEIYGHTVGYACNINAHIGDMSGYTVATNIDTSGINATVDEINAIKQAFSKGVYL